MLLELFQMPRQYSTHPQGSMRGPKVDLYSLPEKTQPAGKCKDRWEAGEPCYAIP